MTPERKTLYVRLLTDPRVKLDFSGGHRDPHNAPWADPYISRTDKDTTVLFLQPKTVSLPSYVTSDMPKEELVRHIIEALSPHELNYMQSQFDIFDSNRMGE